MSATETGKKHLELLFKSRLQALKKGLFLIIVSDFVQTIAHLVLFYI